MEPLEVVRLAQERNLIPRLALGKVAHSNLALAVCAFCARLVKQFAVEIQLWIHWIHRLGAHPTFLRHPSTTESFSWISVGPLPLLCGGP